MAEAGGLRQRKRQFRQENGETVPLEAPTPRRPGRPAAGGSLQAYEFNFQGLAQSFYSLFLAALDLCMQAPPLAAMAERLGWREAAPPGRLPLAAELEVLREEAALLATPVTLEQHELLWRRLWAAWFRAQDQPAPAFEIPHAAWPGMGFQGPDPLTDVRGGGEMALANLVYFAEMYPSDVRGMAERLRRAEATGGTGPEGPPTYPWGAAAIAISHCVAKLLHVARPLAGGAVAKSSQAELATAVEPYWALLQPDTAAESTDAGTVQDIQNPQVREIFSFAFRRFDELWHARSARYFHFPKVVMELHTNLRAEFLDRARRVEARHATGFGNDVFLEEKRNHL